MIIARRILCLIGIHDMTTCEPECCGSQTFCLWCNRKEPAWHAKQ